MSRRFCSKLCYGKSNRGRPRVENSGKTRKNHLLSNTCADCGKVYFNVKRRDKRVFLMRKYCSLKCLYDSLKKRPESPRKERSRVRRTRLKEVGGSHSLGEWETLKAQYNWACPCCGESEPTISLTKDHIVAVSKGGSDNIENIQPLCNPCNRKKFTKETRYYPLT